MNNKKITAKMISRMSKQSLKSSRMRNIFVMITIVLASALLTTILMFAVGQNQQVKNDLSHRQQVGYYNLTNEQVEMLKADDRIAYQIQVKTGVLSPMDGFDVMPYYVSELSDKIQIGELLEGKLPEKENEIAAQAAMLKKMGVNPKVGSTVTFTFYDDSTETFTVSGILNGSDMAKQFSVFFSETYARNDSQLKDMPYEVYAKLYGATTMYPEDCKEVMYLIGSDAGIERKYVSPSKAFIESLSVDTQFVMLYGIVGAVILLACILVIYGVFYLSVIGRIHQFGQLRTIGMTKKQMKKLVSREGVALYLRSAPIGILIGGIAGYFIIPNGFNILNTLLIIALVFVVIYIITMISVRKPARLAATVSPMEALRYVPQDGMKKAANKKLCRKLSPMGLGMMNFSKNRKKATITMLSLALDGILFMTAATYISSFDKEGYSRQGIWEDADFNIFYSEAAVELSENGMSEMQAEKPMGDDMVREISAIDGVEKVDELKSLGIIFDFPKNDKYDDDDFLNLISNEKMKSMEKYIEEGVYDYDKLMSGNYVLIQGNTNVEEIFGWKFQTGDKVIIKYYDGSKMAEKEVTVLGILSTQYSLDNPAINGWFVMPEKPMLNQLSYDSLNSQLLISADSENEASVDEALKEILEKRPELSMEAYVDMKISYEQAANTLFGAISGLAIFIMMFSILSMMNTLITNIVTRKQELAMLESIGMNKDQIRKMLLGESLLLVLATVGVTMTIGTLCGYVLSNILYNTGAFYYNGLIN